MIFVFISGWTNITKSHLIFRDTVLQSRQDRPFIASSAFVTEQVITRCDKVFFAKYGSRAGIKLTNNFLAIFG